MKHAVHPRKLRVPTLSVADVATRFVGVTAIVAMTAAVAFQSPAHADGPSSQVPTSASQGKSQQPPAATGPHVSGDRTVKAYRYDKAIRESIRIDLDMDYNNDGKKDSVVVDIVRPSEPAAQNVKIPVIALPSPYYTSLGRGTDSERKSYNRNGVNTLSPLFHDNYFVEYGYAVATIDAAGSGRSDGCGDIGGVAEIQSVTRVIDWLNGRAKGTYVAGGTGTAVANWSTGSVGLTGKSWDGTLSNGAAATGAEGLRTIVPVAGISSWYDYYRFMGFRIRDDRVGSLAQMVSNNARGCASFHDQLGRDMDTNSMNAGWAERDYVKDAAKVKASVLIAHGQADDNVNMRHAGEWFKALRKNDVSTAVWLHQAEHTDPFDVDRKNWVSYLHQWFDYWLMGLSNNVMSRQGTVEQEIGNFTQDAVWPVGPETSIGFGPEGLGKTGKSIMFIKRGSASQDEAVTNPSQARDNRLVFLTAPVARDVRVSGVPTVKVRVYTTARTVPLSARLVDYGQANRYDGNRASGSSKECYGGQISTDSACYVPRTNSGRSTDTGVIGRGWIDAAYRDGLYSPKAIPQKQWFDVTIPLMMTDNVIKSGHRLGLVLTLGDTALRSSADAQVSFDVGESYLTANFVNADALAPSRGQAGDASIQALGQDAPRTLSFSNDPPARIGSAQEDEFTRARRAGVVRAALEGLSPVHRTGA